MTALALVAASIAALLHLLFFKLESFDWKKPKTWKTFGLESQADADTTASLAYNQGFYNLFLAIGAGVGVKLIWFGPDRCESVGWTLIVFACGSMFAASLVLLSTGKSYARAAAIQGLPALVAVVAALVAAN